jgi:hypothetical protein
MTSKKKSNVNDWPPLMSDAELKDFVLGFVDGRIFTSFHIRERELPNLLHLIFMPLTLGPKLTKKQAGQIAAFWEYYNEALQTGINGYPIFMSYKAIRKEDWIRAYKAIQAEEERRKNIKV